MRSEREGLVHNIRASKIVLGRAYVRRHRHPRTPPCPRRVLAMTPNSPENPRRPFTRLGRAGSRIASDKSIRRFGSNHPQFTAFAAIGVMVVAFFPMRLR